MLTWVVCPSLVVVEVVGVVTGVTGVPLRDASLPVVGGSTSSVSAFFSLPPHATVRTNTANAIHFMPIPPRDDSPTPHDHGVDRSQYTPTAPQDESGTGESGNRRMAYKVMRLEKR